MKIYICVNINNSSSLQAKFSNLINLLSSFSSPELCPLAAPDVAKFKFLPDDVLKSESPEQLHAIGVVGTRKKYLPQQKMKKINF